MLKASIEVPKCTPWGNAGTCYLPLMIKFENLEFIIGIRDPIINYEWLKIK